MMKYGKPSVARGILIVAAVIIAGLAGAFGYVQLREETRRELLEEQLASVERIASSEQAFFENLDLFHSAAIQTFLRSHRALERHPSEEVARQFDEFFPIQEDDSRRSAASLFTGLSEDTGDYTYGVGAYIRPDAELDIREKRLLLAGLQAVRTTGPAWNAVFESLYFHLPEGFVLFAPNRPDGLEFYRQAPASQIAYSEREFVTLVLPENNSLGVTRCTQPTERLFQAGQTAPAAIGCHTPIREAGVHLGAFGTSHDLRGFLSNVVSAGEGSRRTYLMTREGAIIAHPALSEPAELTRQRVETVSETEASEILARRIRRDGRSQGSLVLTNRGSVIGFMRVPDMDWLLISAQPTRSEDRTALFIAVSIFAGVLFMLLTSLTSIEAGLSRMGLSRYFPSRRPRP